MREIVDQKYFDKFENKIESYLLIKISNLFFLSVLQNSDPGSKQNSS